MLPALGDEAALALEPAPRGAGRRARQTPYVLFAGNGVNAPRARTALARLQRPLLRFIRSGRGGGHGPAIIAGNVAGTTTQSLRVSPVLDLTYAVANGSQANMTLGGLNFLIQRNWVNASGGYCSVSYP